MGIDINIRRIENAGIVGSKSIYILFGTCVSVNKPQTFLDRLLRRRPNNAKAIKCVDILRGNTYVDNSGKERFRLDEESFETLRRLAKEMELSKKQSAQIVQTVLQKVEEMLGLP